MNHFPADIVSLEMQLAAAQDQLKKIVRSPQKNQHHMETAKEELAKAQRALAEAKEEEFAIPYDIGLLPDPGVSDAVVLQTEYITILIFRVSRRTLDLAGHSAGYGIVHIERCSLTKFGSPNDEALPGHHLYSKGLSYYGIYEVRNSLWVRNATEINRVSFPRTPDSDQKHFIFTFHDSTFECICRDLRISLSNQPFSEILLAATKELLQ
jgi:hypothetical protein